MEAIGVQEALHQGAIDGLAHPPAQAIVGVGDGLAGRLHLQQVAQGVVLVGRRAGAGQTAVGGVGVGHPALRACAAGSLGRTIPANERSSGRLRASHFTSTRTACGGFANRSMINERIFSISRKTIIEYLVPTQVGLIYFKNKHLTTIARYLFMVN